MTTYLLAATVGDRSAWTVWYLGEEAISAAAAAPTDTGEGGSAPGTMASLGLFFGVAIGDDACLNEEKKDFCEKIPKIDGKEKEFLCYT